MKTMLSWRTQLFVLVVILIIHATGLISLLIAKMESESPQHEALVMFEDEAEHTVAEAERDWVAMNNSLPNTQLAQTDTAPDDEAPNQPEAEPAQPTPQEKQIDDTVALAQQLLDQKEEPILDKESEQAGEWVALEKIQEKSDQISEEKPEEKKEETIAESKQPAQELKVAPAEKKLSLAQLTQGFVQHLEQAAMAVKSNQTGKASIEQMKHLHYCQKIIGCIVNSYKIHSRNVPHDKTMGTLRLQLALNENGTIHTLRMAQSSGNPAIDRFLIAMFQDAASSFPPVPAAFKEKPYHLPTFNIDRLEAFQSQQGWYIDNKMS